jgi:hypothetical protein
MSPKLDKKYNQLMKLPVVDRLALVKMVLMGTADFDFKGSDAGDILWNAKDLVIDFEQNVEIV